VTAARAGAVDPDHRADRARAEATEPLERGPGRRARAAAAATANGESIDQEGVFVVREGKAVFVPVTVGIAGQGYFEVLRA
jgi:hypothetical protein